MIVYNKLGYKIKALSKDDGKEIFKYLLKYKVNDSMEPEVRTGSRDGLKKLVRDELEIRNHTPLGLYFKDELIGICFSELYTKNLDVAKISYLKIDEEHNNKIGPHILFNFMTNELYKEIRITFKNTTLDKFGKIARVYPKIIGISSFREDYISRIDKFMKDN